MVKLQGATTLAAAAGLLMPLFTPLPALAHPHIFAEARLEVAIGEEGAVTELRHVWRFDEFFSSTVLLEFDANGNLLLEREELEAIGDVIRQSLADFDYFTMMTQDGTDIAIHPPQQIFADFQDNQLLIFFAVEPERAAALEGTISVGVYDPTMYTAIDFIHDSDLVVIGETADCERRVVRPDPDQIIAENQASLTDAFFNDPDGYDITQLFATRLELKC